MLLDFGKCVLPLDLSRVECVATWEHANISRVYSSLVYIIINSCVRNKGRLISAIPTKPYFNCIKVKFNSLLTNHKTSVIGL